MASKQRHVAVFTLLASLVACGSIETAEELMAAAQPDWRPAGAVTASGAATFLSPPGYTQTLYSDAIALRSAVDDTGAQCEIFILDPRPTATGTEAKYQQILDAAASLFPDTELQDQYGGADPLTHRWRGSTGRGWSYVGLILTAYESVDVLPFLADFGGTAYPVIIVEPRSSLWDCIDSLGDFGLAPATVFHSLAVDGFAPTQQDAVAQGVIGKWFSSDGSASSLYVFGANGRYIDAGAYGGVVELSPGEWTSASASWSGTGSFLVREDVLGLFPSDDTARSRFLRPFEVRNDAGVWERKLCWVASYDGEAYTHCLYESAG